MANGLPGLDLGSNWTPLTRNVIVTLFAIYVVQLLSQGAITDLFAWQPFGAGFQPWQVVTAFLLGSPDPLWAVLDWLALFFFLAPVENLIGRRGLVQALGVAWAVAVAVSATLIALGVVGMAGPYMGIGPFLAALLGLFGFLMPQAQIRIYFVLPIKAIWIAWATGLLSFLYLLASRDLGSALTFFAWGGASVWLAIRNGAARRFQLRWKKRQVERKLSRFEVIEGGRTPEKRPKRGSDPGDWVH
ncbi:MAG: hypothetical protein Q8P41_06600 [Pseudomonadota bacterium]|nr:hypothetical protein [Pseudomonadota bacterium]